MKLADQLTYRLLSSFSGILSRTQLKTRYKTAFYFYAIFYHFVPVRKKTALNNIQFAYPGKDHIWYEKFLKRSYQFFSRSFLEFFALPNSYFKGSFSVSGENELVKALDENKGVIMVTGHMGPWEMLAAWIGYNNYPFSGIAQRQRNRGANQFFKEKRGQSGIKHIFRKSGFNEMYNVLKNNNILGIAMDQDAKKRGLIVDFYGHPVSVPKGASIFHQKTGAPIVFISISELKPYHYHVQISRVDSKPEDDLGITTQSFTNVLEAFIKQYPEQYFWFHNKFKTTRKLIKDEAD